MRIVAYLSSVLVLACGARAVSPSDTIAVSARHEHYWAPNGLEIVLQPDHRAPLVSVRVRYHTGSKDDPKDRAGIAHLLEHLTFASGTMNRWQELGAIDADAATTLDATDYWVTLPSPALDNALWLEAERMGSGSVKIDEATLAREKEVVVAEWSEKIGNRPYGLLEPTLRASLFPADHPYRHLAIGDPAEVRAIPLADVVAFAKKHLVPDNATLIVTGDFDPVKARAAIARDFGAIPPGEPLRTRLVVTPVQPVRDVARMQANVSAPVLAVAWLGPPVGAEGWDAAKVALGRIGGAIVRRRGFAVTATTDGGRLGTLLELRVRGDATTSFEELAAEIALATKVIGRPDLTSDRAGEIASTLFGFEDLTTRTAHIAEELDLYGGADYANEQIHAARQLDPSDVRDAIDTFFKPERAAWVRIEPSKDAPPGGKVLE